MIAKTVDDRSVSVMPEEPDDLLALRRIIREGDRIAGSTSRVIRQSDDYSRPDRGRRIRVRIALSVERASLDSVLDRLRVHGTIAESDSESVAHGSHHSLLIEPGRAVTITKKRWSSLERRLVRRGGEKAGYVLVAIDTSDCGVARLKGTRLQVMQDLRSGQGGKRYKTSFRIEPYFEEIARAISSVYRDGDEVIAFGPGETKKKFAGHFLAIPAGKKSGISVVEGIDSGGEDGIRTFTKSQAMRDAMARSKLAAVSSVIDSVMAMASRKDGRFTMGLGDARRACAAGAIDALVFSDRALAEGGEQEVVDLLNDADATGARLFAVDSTTDLGLRVSGLGGIVSVLRFPVAR